MVNNNILDNTFHALADPTRRGIISLLVEQTECRVGDLAAPFDMSLAAISKHVNVLERATLVSRNRRGREVLVRLNTQPLIQARDLLEFYQHFWQKRFSSLEKMLKQDMESNPR